jgi:hypothetical protein
VRLGARLKIGTPPPDIIIITFSIQTLYAFVLSNGIRGCG